MEFIKKYKFLIVLFVLVYLYFSEFINFICYVACLLKAVKYLLNKKVDDIKLILILLVLLNFLDVVEYTFNSILLVIIPFYYLVKLILVFWLLLPDLRGLKYGYSVFLYKLFINPNSEVNCYNKLNEYFIKYDKKYASVSTNEEAQQSMKINNVK